MDLDLDGIIRCIKQGDENGVDAQLQQFNKEVTHAHVRHVPEDMPALLLAAAENTSDASRLSCSLHSASSLTRRRETKRK